MKRKSVLFVLGLLLFAALFSIVTLAKESNTHRSPQYYNNLIKLFPESLESNIPGIVESTIYNIVVLKKYYPSGNYEQIVNDLNRISEEHPDPSIRYKAHLASMYLTINNIVVHPVSNAEDHEYIFKQIAEQLESKLLVSN